MKTEEFVAYVVKRVIDAGFSLKLINEEFVTLNSPSITCSGYCDDKEIVIATKKEEQKWIGILAHEYCHLTQLLDKSFQSKKDYEALEDMDKGLAGKRISNKKFREAVDLVQAMELDNELRAIHLLKRLKVNIDIDKYIRGANAYIYLHTVIRKYKKWIKPNSAPYRYKQIMELMPDKMLSDYSKVPEKVEKLMCRLCLGVKYIK